MASAVAREALPFNEVKPAYDQTGGSWRQMLFPNK